MLVLARKSNELIHIGDSITVKVISIRNGQVKLGIEAPRDMRVTRDGRRDGRGGLSPLQGGAPGMSIEARGDGSPGDHREV
jgi:carbon storage regulator